MTSNYAIIHDTAYQKVENPNYLSNGLTQRIEFLRHSYLFSLSVFFISWRLGYKLSLNFPLINQNKAALYLISFSLASFLQNLTFESMNS